MKNHTPLLAAAAVFTGLAVSNVTAAPPEGLKVRLLVKPKASMSEAALDAMLSAKGASEKKVIDALNVRVIEVPAHAAEALSRALSRNKDVEYVEPDAMASGLATPNDQYFNSQWWLTKVQAPQAWDITTGSAGTVIAVVDSGVHASHPDISARILPGYDFINNDADATDDWGHGTAVAGVIGASSNNSIGTASMTWANPILPVKVLGADGNGPYSAISNGIIWAADQGAKVINLSLGGTQSSITLQNAVNYAWNLGAVVVASVGNNGLNVLTYPSACNNVIAVSATNSTDGFPTWSNFGPHVDVSAPGEGILTLYGTNLYASWNGTSFSCPIASGVLALMKAANPQLTNVGLRDLLIGSSDDLGAAGFDIYYGHGRVNALSAVQDAVDSIVVDTAAPTVAFTSPGNGATVSGTVNVSMSSADNIGVTRVDFYLNGVLYNQSTSSTPTFTWNTSNSVDGSYTLEARAFDAANNFGSSTITVTVANAAMVDTIAPSVAITSPTGGIRVVKNQKITIQSSDNIGVTQVRLYIDGNLFATSGSANVTFTWNTSSAARGAHILQAYAYDAAGNIGASAPVSVNR